MSKFWAACGLLLVVGIGLTFLPSGDGINFTDLETECQYDRGSNSDIDLNHRRMSFSGYYPVESPEANLNYDYSISGDEITLNIRSSDTAPLTDFYNTCNAVAVYDAETDRLESGSYMVTVNHDGERADRKVIRVS